MKIKQLEVFKKEIKEFPISVREDIFSLVERYIEGNRLNAYQFKTFKIDKNIKIQEFKVKDQMGNWRAISCILKKNILVFIYAFHKKSQSLSKKDRDIITKRIRRVNT